MEGTISIRRFDPDSASDADALWSILQPIVAAGETYALPRSWGRDETLSYWVGAGHTVYLAVDKWNVPVGTFFIHPNQKGGGGHVCNCGYATAAGVMGKGVGYQMCQFSLQLAKELGFRAMQYNFVISSNIRAVALWQRCGFQIVGTIPEGFQSPSRGYVDVFIMYQKL
jgi:GNAT superfamily N-acetyltransferase